MKIMQLLLLMIYFIVRTDISFADSIRVENIKDKVVRNGVVYYKNETKPFSGRFITEKTEEEYYSGIRNGFFKGEFEENEIKYTYEGRYTEGIKHGEWIIRYPQGQRRAVVKYNYDQPHGKWTYFFESGLVEAYENFKDGTLYGETVIYNPKGEIITKVNYKDGLLDGKALFYYGENIPETDTFFINGKIDGKIDIFSRRGSKILTGTYKNNKREGVWRVYYQKGELKTIIHYLNGLKNGETVIYDKGGTIIQKTVFKNGMPVNSDGTVDESSKNRKIKDNILERFKKFNRNLNFIKYDKILSEI